MATRQQLTVWIPLAFAVVFAVGYIEWRMSRAVEIAPAREPAGAASPAANARGSNHDGRAFALAATAHARAERAEQAVQALEEEIESQGDDESQESSEDAQRSVEEKRERERVQRTAFLERLEERFTAEPVNPAWRDEKESALLSVGTVLTDFGVTMEDAECASSMCKIRLSHPSSKRLSRSGVMEFLKSAHEEGSPLTQLAFNFKYEDGATVLYGTTTDLSEEATQ